MSLTRTLTLLVTTTVLMIALVAAIWSYIESNHELGELFDAELAQSTRIVQGLVRNMVESPPDHLSKILEETVKLLETRQKAGGDDAILPEGSGHKYEKKIAFEVWSPEGEPLLDTLAIAEHLPLEPGYSWTESIEFSWRTFTLQDPETGFWIRTAQREDVREELSQELAMGNVLPLVFAMPLLMAAILIATQLGLRPLRRLERPIRHMAPENLHPLDDQHAPKEVSGLVQAVNGLLKRMDMALERERRFSANAAHELRTPLSALRLNLEQACEFRADEFGGLTESIDRMVHLVEQMLLLSRVDSGSEFDPEHHNLSAVVEQSIADVTPLALKKGIEAILEDTTCQAVVSCHAALINTLMRSLLANAIQYSPRDTVVKTHLSTSGDGYIIYICDEGPGISVADRERALSRFVRLDQRVSAGAGLGLAIACRIVELHDGMLTLNDRPDGGSGLSVEVWLPARRPPDLEPV